jgi:hypothetical protein
LQCLAAWFTPRLRLGADYTFALDDEPTQVVGSQTASFTETQHTLTFDAVL